MADIYKYFQGRCSICGYEGDVRHKNIWLIGSEGTDMCWPCEKAMNKFLDDRKRRFTFEKLEKLREKARRKRSSGVRNE